MASFHEWWPLTGIARMPDTICTDCTEHNIKLALGQPTFLALQEQYNSFLTVLSKLAPLPQFWISYIILVHFALQFLHATKEGDWNLHLQCLKQMIPWFFAYDRVYYSCYMPVYLCEMLSLPIADPERDRLLRRGEIRGVEMRAFPSCNRSSSRTNGQP